MATQTDMNRLARLYGTTYADLEYKVLNILNEFMNDIIKHPDANIDIINL